MALLSFLRRSPTAAINQDEERRKYSQSRYAGPGFRGIRLMTPEEERVKRGALPAELSPSKRVFSLEGQARANSLGTNDPAIVGTRDPVTGQMVGGAARFNGMRDFLAPNIAPYGVSKQGSVMDAREYAASKGRGTRGAVLRFRADEASRLQDKQYTMGLRSNEEVARQEADAATALATARYMDQPKVVGGSIYDPRTGQFIQAPPSAGKQTSDQAEADRLSKAQDLSPWAGKGKYDADTGFFYTQDGRWNPFKKSRVLVRDANGTVNEIDPDSFDPQYHTRLTPTEAAELSRSPAKQPEAKVDYQTADELIAAYENGKIDRATAEAIIKAKGW